MRYTHDHRRASEGFGINLTPMVDMVFQLILFFVVVNDFSSSQLDPVILPKAPVAQKSDVCLFI